MADDGDGSNKPKSHRPQETFHRAQETQVEHKFPHNPTGIVPIPHGSRGPKSLYLKRKGDSFGFTLRHFIVYPPDSVAENDGRHAAVGALSTPMDTIFVKNVKEGGPAKFAGLQRGDRLIRVNNILVTDKSYAQVVQLIQNSPDYLHLLVVPKEDDVLQRYFSETAYNPASNQPQSQLTDHQAAQHFLTQAFIHPPEFQVDAISWRSLQNSYGYDYRSKQYPRSTDNLDVRQSVGLYNTDDPTRRHRTRAQPQVAQLRKMGRRASDGCALSERDYNVETMKTMQKTNYLGEPPEMPGLRYPNSAGCRLSLDAGRRESSSSLMSSLADGSKDSLTSSCDSTSTLTGHDTDDSAIMSRFRRNFQQKEEFLKMPLDPNLIQREFYGKPKKLERAMWPPSDPSGKGTKPTHQNFQRVKNDIETERELSLQTGGGVPNNYLLPQQKGAKSPNDRIIYEYDKVKEASIAPSFDQENELINGAYNDEVGDEDQRLYPSSLQVVHTRARQFESGKPIPEDDPVVANRTNFYRSELARLSSKRVVPNVTERAQEYEIRSSESKKDIPVLAATKRNQRDTRSLESNGSTSSSCSLGEQIAKKLSGNVIISTGSKYIHCPPPSEYGKPTDMSENQAFGIRARSNSTDSWVAALKSENKKISRQDALDDGNKKQNRQSIDDSEQILHADLPPLIPEPVEHMHFTPSVSITPAPDTVVPQKAIRPNQLNLEGPIRPARHLKPPTSLIDTPMRRPISPVIGEDNKPVVVKRRTKSTNLADDERITRRESYLKATEGGRMHFDSDLSDGDISPQVLRSGSASGNSSSSASLDREKVSASPLEKDNNVVIREGPLHCKITEIDGKRFGDRSWKQIWATLKGPKLYLYIYKDKHHHQSPMGAPDPVDPSLASGVDMRASDVRVAEDYTKRKHVLRVSSIHPCRSELLLQAENADEFTDWFKTLQDQMATNTEAESKLDPSSNKQQAVPQTVPASTSILVQGGSRLSPQPSKGKSSTTRNRSPTGQSPVCKTRKPSHTSEPSTSPKAKTWRVRVAKQFRQAIGASTPNSPTAPEVSTIGIPLDQCLPSLTNPFVPKFVEVCTDIVNERGLHTIGIYRVPGNNASITALTEEVNRNYDSIPTDDPRWNDLHVVSSLLKSYFRKIPDSLVTSALYPHFIKADKIENPTERLKEIRRLVKNLPPHNYHTLKHIILHLRRVVDNAHINKMEAKNLAIVFGPNIVRPEEENVESLVSNMTHQCKIVETLLAAAEWIFADVESDALPLPAIVPDVHDEGESATNQALLLDNISKYEALKDKEKNGALFSSIISAAQRKVKRKSTKGAGSLNDNKEEVTSPGFSSVSLSHSDLKDSTTSNNVKTGVIPTTVTEIEKTKKPPEKVPWFNYSTDKEDFKRRIENFKQETQAMLTMPRNLEISVSNIAASKTPSAMTNVNQARLSTKHTDPQLLKTYSASNVFTRTINMDNRHSLDNSYTVQYNTTSDSDFDRFGDRNRNVESVKAGNGRHISIRRGSSVENINCSTTDLNANGALKKGKYEYEGELNQRVGSLDSLNKIVAIDDDTDLVTALTTLYDRKLLEKKNSQENLLSGENLPFADESPEKNHHILIPSSASDKENVPNLNDLYRNPSLHKNQLLRLDNLKLKESQEDFEKDEDSTIIAEKQQHMTNMFFNNNKTKNTSTNSKLKRSESLNKPERTVSPLNNKVKRSESLNKTGDKLKRSDSLTKTEKTESNLNKRRELASSMRRSKDTKLKRKNGMPDRSIKRRHTVGGTKDPDKVTWLDNKNQEEEVLSSNKENKERNLRTSSPDLSSTRREKLYLEISFLGPENMVVALKQHLMGTRPQSFPDTAVFKVPLESHV